MPTAAAPIRLDRELAAAARDAAQTMSRSVAEQVSHWARLGRELERSPQVSVVQVQAVLRGEADYDALNAPAQAVVRTAWEEAVTARLASLDLASELAAAGRDYAEAGPDGAVRIKRAGRAAKGEGAAVATEVPTPRAAATPATQRPANEAAPTTKGARDAGAAPAGRAQRRR